MSLIKTNLFGKLAVMSLWVSMKMDKLSEYFVYKWFLIIKNDPQVPESLVKDIYDDPNLGKIIKELENGQSGKKTQA